MWTWLYKKRYSIFSRICWFHAIMENNYPYVASRFAYHVLPLYELLALYYKRSKVYGNWTTVFCQTWRRRYLQRNEISVFRETRAPIVTLFHAVYGTSYTVCIWQAWKRGYRRIVALQYSDNIHTFFTNPLLHGHIIRSFPQSTASHSLWKMKIAFCRRMLKHLIKNTSWRSRFGSR